MTKRICDFCGQDNEKQRMYTLESNSTYDVDSYEGLDICNDCLKLLCKTIKKKRSEQECAR